jgi:hypothetical protein
MDYGRAIKLVNISVLCKKYFLFKYINLFWYVWLRERLEI